MKEITLWERSMDRVTSNGLMAQHIKESFLTIIYTAMECMSGLMADDLKETGKTTKWTEKVFSIGLTKGGMKENMLMTRKRVKGILFGQMAGNT